MSTSERNPPEEPTKMTANPEVPRLADFLVPVFAPALANLSETGLASFGATVTQEAYLTASAEFGAVCEEAITAAFPTGKARTELGIRASVVNLNRRLSQLAEDHFSKFNESVDGFCKQNLAAGSDASITEKWRRAVIQEYASKLWKDVRNAWVSWLDYIRKVTGGESFGARVRLADDPEYLILRSHEQQMAETLARIAHGYSLSDDVVRRMTPRDARQTVLRLDRNPVNAEVHLADQSSIPPPGGRGAQPEIQNRASNTTRSRKGDLALLAGKTFVNFKTAEAYLGISERQRQSLMEKGTLVVKGKGHNRKITTDSLLEYLPTENPN